MLLVGNDMDMIEKVKQHLSSKFNMKDCKLVKVPIPVGTKLSVDQCPKSEEEIKYMAHVTYASVVGCLMYAMVCTRPNISHVVGVLSRYVIQGRLKTKVC